MEERKDLIRIDVNIEKMPVIFFGPAAKKRALEKQIFETGKPYVLLSTVSEDGSYRKLSVAPSAIYGLPTEFDQDVIVVVFSCLHDLTKKIGSCPRTLRIPLSNFPKIMCLKYHGRLYKDIERATRRISNFEILQEEFIKVKEKNGTLRVYDERSLRLFHLHRIYKEEKVTKKGKKIKKYYVDLGIPDWVINNINNFYTTEFDVKKYFAIKGGRVRKLYRYLDLIRYKKSVFVHFETLVRELWITDKPVRNKRRTIKRTFTALVESGFVKSFDFDEYGVTVSFASVKKREKKPVQLTFDEQARQESLVSEMLERLGDKNSENWYHKVAQRCPDDLIYKCLSLTREAIETRGIRKSKGAIFTGILKRECKKLDIALS